MAGRSRRSSPSATPSTTGVCSSSRSATRRARCSTPEATRTAPRTRAGRGSRVPTRTRSRSPATKASVSPATPRSSPPPARRTPSASSVRGPSASSRPRSTESAMRSTGGRSVVALLARCRSVCDESGAATVGCEAERPADEDEQPVLEADQVPEVDEQPCCPGGKAAEPDAFYVGDCRCSPDRGEVALVAVAERPVLAASEPRADDAGRVPPLLHRDWCEGGQHDGLAARVADAHHVADREYLRVPGKGQIRLDGNPAGAIMLGSGQFGELAGEAGCGDAGSPNDGAGGDPLAAPVSALERHPGGVDPDHGAAGEDGYAEALQRPLGLRRERGWEARQHTIGGLDENDAGAAGIDGAEVAPQRVPRQLGDLAGHLDAGGTGADDDEREPGVPCLCVRLALGGFEGGEEAAANGECTLERLDLGGVLPPFLVAEVRVVRAAGDDQGVVAEPFRRRHRRDGA